MSAELALLANAAAPIIAAQKVEPCYACAEQACAEEVTYPADMLAWSWQTGKFHCDSCFEHAPEQLGDPGPSLEWCLEHSGGPPDPPEALADKLLAEHGVQNALAHAAEHIAEHRRDIRYWLAVTERIKARAAAASREAVSLDAEGRTATTTKEDEA